MGRLASGQSEGRNPTMPLQRSGPTVAVSVKLTGPFEGVVRMLFALQSPTAWRTIEKLALKSDAQPPNVVADLELHQYFLPSTSAGPTPQAHTP